MRYIKTRWPSLVAKSASFPPSGSWLHGRENLLLCMWPSLGLYIRAVRTPIQGDGLSIHSGSPSPLSYLFHSSCIPHCKNFRAFNRGTRTRSFSKTRRRASAWTSIIPCVFGYYHRLPRAARHMYKFTRRVTKHQHTPTWVPNLAFTQWCYHTT